MCAYLWGMRLSRCLSLLLLLSVAALAGDPVDKALKSLAEEAAAPNGSRTPRLAVMSILPAAGEDNRYGQWLSEALASEIRKQGRFRLFERSRLDAVAKEHALALSGALGAEEAKKVGELVPVDFLLSGSWTRLGEEVEANLRLLDVVSGEVHLALRRRIPLDEAHKGLVAALPPPVVATAAAPRKDSSGCTEWTDSVKIRLADVTGEAAVRRLEGALTRLPFPAWSPCAHGHYRAMDLLSRQKVPVPRYRAFLLATLDTVAIPSEDDRGPAVVEFLASTAPVEEEEWDVIEAAATRCRPVRMGVLLGGILVPEPKDAALQRKRIDGLMRKALDGKVGRPLPGAPEEVFLALMPLLSPRKEGVAGPEGWWLWQAWSGKLKPDEQEHGRNLRRLATNLFRRDVPAAQQRVLADWLCARWGRLEERRTLAEEVERHWTWMERNPVRKEEFLREGKTCAETFTEAAKANPYVNQKMAMRKTALRYGFSMPGFLPPVAELADSIRSKDWKSYGPAAELLVAYGPAAAPALPAVTRQLRRTKGEGGASIWRFRGDLARVVGNAGAKDSAAVAEVVGMLVSGTDEPVDSAIAALGQLGRAAVPALQRQWNGIEDYRKVYMVRAVSRMPKEDQPLEWLRKRRMEPAHASLLRAIDDVLDP